MATGFDATTLVPHFKTSGADYVPPKAYASRVQLQLGQDPGVATVVVPLAVDGERAPAVACVDGAPTQNIKWGTPCDILATIDSVAYRVFSGFVTDVLHKFGPDEDYLVVTLKDHRWLMTGRKFEGSYYSPGDGTVLFCEARPAIFNERGQPNMTLSDEGCMFCEPNLGLTAGEAPPTTPTEGKASYWTPEYAFKYMRYVMKHSTGAVALAHAAFPHLKQLPATVSWDAALGSELTTDDDGFTTANKAHEVDIDGLKVNAALNAVCQMAGPYTIDVEPSSDTAWTGVLKIKRTQFGGTDTVTDVTRRIGGGQDKISDDDFIDGEFGENGDETFTSAAIIGAPVIIETRVTLQACWTSTRLSTWKLALADTSAGATPDERFAWANTLEPGVCRDYRLDPTYDYYAGTTENGKGLATRLRKPLAHLITSYLQGSTAAYTDLLNTPMNIRFEVSDDSGTTWHLIPESGVTMLPDGTIRLTEAREQGLTFGSWGTSLQAKLAAASSITANQVRATLAIPCEHRLIEACRLETDPDTALNLYDGEAVDTDRMAAGTIMQYCAVEQGKYCRDIRNGSYPTPETVGGTEQSDVLRDDAAFLASHVQRKLGDYGRLRKRGFFTYLGINVSWRPGYQVDNCINIDGNDVETTFPVRAVGTAIVYECGRETNFTHLVIGG